MPENPHDVGELFAGLADATPTSAHPARAAAYHPGPPATHLDEAQLRVAFAENLFELFRSMAALPDALLEESPAGGRHRAFPFSPMFTGLWRTRLGRDQVDDALVETADWLTRQAAPFAFWWVDEDTRPADLGERLLARGWAPWEERAPGMAARMDELDFSALGAVPPGYRQVRVTTEAELGDFGRAFVAGFEVPEWAAQAWVDATLSFGIDQAPWRSYVGYLDDEPVASNMLFTGAGVASVFGVATAPTARGRGIGAAITLAAYDDARAAGFRYAVLFATDLGAPVYRRIGFRDVDATMSRYLWRAED